MRRTMDEIVKKIQDKGFDSDPLGFGLTDLTTALDYEHVEVLLTDEGKRTMRDTWNLEMYLFKNDDDVRKEMRRYMPFARDKCDSERGISANRSINHYIAWAWLIDDAFYQELEKMYDTQYESYGKPILDRIEKYLKESK